MATVYDIKGEMVSFETVSNIVISLGSTVDGLEWVQDEIGLYSYITQMQNVERELERYQSITKTMAKDCAVDLHIFFSPFNTFMSGFMTQQSEAISNCKTVIAECQKAYSKIQKLKTQSASTPNPVDGIVDDFVIMVIIDMVSEVGAYDELRSFINGEISIAIQQAEEWNAKLIMPKAFIE